MYAYPCYQLGIYGGKQVVVYVSIYFTVLMIQVKPLLLKTEHSIKSDSLPCGKRLLHYQQHMSGQNQQHLLHILLHYLSHQLQMLHEAKSFPLHDLQKHYST